MKKLIVLLTILLSSPKYSTAEIIVDTTPPYAKQFQANDWERLTKDLNYPGTQPYENPAEKKLLPVKQFPWVKYVVYIIISGLLVFVLIRLFRTKKLPEKKLPERIIIEEIAAEDFKPEAPYEKYVDDALEGGDFRSAIRFSFLIAIRDLSSKKLIYQSKDKTNFEYILELSLHPVSEFFNDITKIFERTWYGDIQADNNDYSAFRDKFLHFQSQLNSH